MTLVEKAQKVIGFRLQIINACKKQGIAAPTDEQISDYINGYGIDIKDFMADYTKHEGMFRSPIKDFADKVWEYAWSEKNKPTMEEMTAWTEKNGYDVDNFLHQRTIASYEPLERATLLKTLEMGDVLLVKLWNKFIEESAMYGEDSYIYDLKNEKDVKFLNEHMEIDEKKEVKWQQTHNNARYIQWFAQNGNAINVKTDIKGVIIAYWGDIFSRIMGYPDLYGNLMNGQIGTDYFFDVFFPTIREFTGYTFDERDGSLTYKEK